MEHNEIDCTKSGDECKSYGEIDCSKTCEWYAAQVGRQTGTNNERTDK